MRMGEPQMRLMSASLNRYHEIIHPQAKPNEQMPFTTDQRIQVAQTMNTSLQENRDAVGIVANLNAKFAGNAVDVLNTLLYPDNSTLNPTFLNSPELRYELYLAAVNLDRATIETYKDLGKPLDEASAKKLEALNQLRQGLLSITSNNVGENASVLK